jgi:hypothetical protein
MTPRSPLHPPVPLNQKPSLEVCTLAAFNKGQDGGISRSYG